METIQISSKQAEYNREANHRWNFKIGAVQCGKTYIDTLYVIPKRIIERLKLPGLVFICGVSKGTIQRNIIEPMQELYGNKLVTDIGSNNTSMMFGEKVYCIGSDNVGAVRKIRGARIKYLYIDEVVDINQEVFELLKSRLSFDYSICDASGNPQSQTHYVKDFIESDADIYVQQYTIFDNPFLPQEYVKQLCKEYEGTVYYNRYILGQWCNAEGIIYRKFADNPQKYAIEYKPVQQDNGIWTDNLPAGKTIVGVDYGGTKSGQAFVCTRIANDYSKVIVMASRRITSELDAKELEDAQIDFLKYCRNKFHCNIDYVFPDNEEVVHIRSLKNRVDKLNWDTIVRGSIKEPINDRIKCGLAMISYDVLGYIEGECDTFVSAMSSALWDDKAKEDTRLDDFTTDIDSMDAFEYSFERYIRKILDRIEF